MNVQLCSWYLKDEIVEPGFKCIVWKLSVLSYGTIFEIKATQSGRNYYFDIGSLIRMSVSIVDLCQDVHKLELRTFFFNFVVRGTRFNFGHVDPYAMSKIRNTVIRVHDVTPHSNMIGFQQTSYHGNLHTALVKHE